MQYNIQKKLLCKFVNSHNYLSEIEYVKRSFNIIDGKIFVFVNDNNSNDMFLTFNIKKETNSRIKNNVISIHRKRQTNTLYTLNAMNKLIEDENGGIFDETYQIDWELYKNTMILTNDPGVKIIELKLFSIVKI